MQEPKFDPGLTQQYTASLRRAINPDGTFNVIRRGSGWRDVHPYLHLVSVSWPKFFAIIFSTYILINVVFAGVYYALGPAALQGGTPATPRFLNDLFFSSQTLTTVGFGSISPQSEAANVVAGIEALFGLLGFAVATGVMFGRVSRPSARIGFSERALIAPYQEGKAFEFRMVNRRTNSLMELEVTVTFMRVVPVNGRLQREFDLLKLERKRVLFFPLTWTVVHAIEGDSPLAGKTHDDLAAIQAEFLVLVKGWDETFGQTVHQRFSYRYDEIEWDAKFTPAFAIDSHGDMVLEVNRVGAYIAAVAPAANGTIAERT
jgi:inward rectifier potassium channel